MESDGLSSSMLACNYKKHGSKSHSVSRIMRPDKPTVGQLMIKVHSASINPADWKSASGEQALLLKFSWPRVYGFDFSGEVVEVGQQEDSTDSCEFKVGDEVFGMIQGLPQFGRGTLAEFVVVESKICAKRPPKIPHAQCASLPLVAITAVKMMRACGLTEGGDNGNIRMLITGGAGGVGTVAIQLAKAMFSCGFVTVTASPGVKTALCLNLGADEVINYHTAKFHLSADDEEIPSSKDGCKGTFSSKPFDIILDCTGEASKCVGLLVAGNVSGGGGQMCSILAGPTAEALRVWLAESEIDTACITVGVRAFLLSGWGGGIFQAFSGGRGLQKQCAKRGGKFSHIIGTGNGEIMGKLAVLLESGKIRAVVDKEFALADSVEAIAYQKSGRAAGKVVVNVVLVPAAEPQSLAESE
jgi:NADPH:quinone reductase-like Zn-dependent oxidoreductase